MHSFPHVQEVINLFAQALRSSVLKTVLKAVHYNMRSKSQTLCTLESLGEARTPAHGIAHVGAGGP